MTEILELDNSNFDIIRKSNIPVLVDFWSAGCRPCRMMIPILNKLVEEYEDEVIIAKCDAADNAELAAKYNVTTVPTLILFNKGKIADTFYGVQSEQHLTNAINELL